MADQTKEEKQSATAKNLIASFEKGEVTQNSLQQGVEKPLSRPGAAKKLQQVYEEKSKPEPATTITKTSGKVVTVPASPVAKKTPRNVLVVYAHWEKKSFNGKLLESTVKTLTKAGHKVTVSDLYAMNWNPCVSKEDIKGDLQNKEGFNYLEEVGSAVQRGAVGDALAAEHKKMQDADLIVFQFPMSWYSYPAILKGWLDRCLTTKFAFNSEEGKLFDKGLMKGKKAVLSFTTGGTKTAYAADGIDGDMNVILWPMQLTLRFSGFDVLAPQISYNVSHASAEDKERFIDTWTGRLSNIFEEKSLRFVGLENFDIKKGLAISEDSEVMKGLKEGAGLNVGQHLGKVAPKDSMTRAPLL